MAERGRAALRPGSTALGVLLVSLVAFGPLSTDMYLPSLPILAAVFDAGTATVQLTLSVFLIGFAVSQLVYGPLSDRFGRRPVILAGTAIYAGASLGCALAPSIELLIACRFLQAVGASSGPVLGRAVVRDLYGRDHAARMFAYMSVAVSMAPAVGPIAGGYLTVWFGWTAVFWFLTLFGAAVLIATGLGLGESNRHRDRSATRPARVIRNVAVLLRHRAFRGYVLVATFCYGVIFSFISGSSFVLMDQLGLDAGAYGVSFGTVVLGYTAGSFGAGRLTLRVGLDRMIRIGTSVMVLGGLTMAALALAGIGGVAAVLAPFLATMVGVGLAFPNAMAGAVGPFPDMAGLASSVLGFVQMVVAALIGLAVAAGTGDTPIAMTMAIALSAMAAFAACRTLPAPNPAPAAAPQASE